jgi:hypothetical protein
MEDYYVQVGAHSVLVTHCGQDELLDVIGQDQQYVFGAYTAHDRTIRLADDLVSEMSGSSSSKSENATRKTG